MNYYDNQTYYDILGIKEDATTNNIIAAKDRLKFGDPDSRAPFSMWSKIDEAYKVLSDPEKRKQYDEKLKASNNITYTQKKLENIHQPKVQNFNNNMNTQLNNETIDYLNDTIIPTLKKTAKEVVTAIPTVIMATVTIVKELNKKSNYKLSKDSNEKTISQIKTEDSELIEEYRKKLDQKVNNVLSQYRVNYNLEIDRLRYETYIELLNKRIEQKENQVVKKGRLLIYKMQLTALKRELQSFKVSLERVNSKQNPRKQDLAMIYESLTKVDKKIEENKQSPTKRIFALKNLEAKRNNLMSKKKVKIDRIKSNREYYAIFKDSFISAHSKTHNFVDNLFVPIDQIDDKRISI